MVYCEYCNREFLKRNGNVEKHENACYLNPKNIKICPVCNSPIKQWKYHKTCSNKCKGIYFRDVYVELNKEYWTDENRSLHSLKFGGDGILKEDYREICFKYHKKECIICGEKYALDVHHRNHNDKDNSAINLIPLCRNHHFYMHVSKYTHLIDDEVWLYYLEFLTQQDL
jgi:hypothetical protein